MDLISWGEKQKKTLNNASNLPSFNPWNKMLNKRLLQYFCTSAHVL